MRQRGRSSRLVRFRATISSGCAGWFPQLYSGRGLGNVTPVHTLRIYWLALGASLALTPQLWAGGSGLNVVVVVNQSSSNSVQLGNYYLEQRQVPAQNFL